MSFADPFGVAMRPYGKNLKTMGEWGHGRVSAGEDREALGA